jgi:mannose-1-phosphate guanylyltransferase
MLEHTIDRAAVFCSPGRVITVISHGQRVYVNEIMALRSPGETGWVVEQPVPRGTAPGIYGGLTYILEQDPEATVVVLPSDHFIYPEEEFLNCLDAATQAAEHWNDRVILLAAKPTGPETDYGWIMTGPARELPSNGTGAFHIAQVVGFYEKPDAVTARYLYRRHGLWNTMVMVGKVRAFNILGWRALPEIMWKFETLRQVLRAVRTGRVPVDHEEYALAHVYGAVPEADFCRNVLQCCAANAMVVPMDGVHWSDWGRPERLLETMEHLGWSRSLRLPILAMCQ